MRKLAVFLICLTAAASGNTNWMTTVTDAASASDCTVGSGTAKALCISNGTAWVPLNSAGGAGTGAKLGTLPQYFSTGGSNTNTAVSAFNLAAAPGSTVGQMWEVSGSIMFTGTITCSAGTFAATVTWTDGVGANSYSPVSVAYGSLSSAVASGTSIGGHYNFSFQFVQKSSVAPTFSTSLPTCSALPYDWFVSARRIG
jgi:hypothetical protein